MTEVFSKALTQTITINRIIGELKGDGSGPTLIFFAGIHGNEPSGVFALKKVMDTLSANGHSLKGKVIAIAGNLPALKKGVRYIDYDLNRIWTRAYVSKGFISRVAVNSTEHREQTMILEILKKITSTSKGPFYFFDLHTTSSDSIPFITINDTLLNRKLSLRYSVPVILGIEEYLDGPILSYINQMGYVSIGFEAGQHDEVASIEKHVAFIYKSLQITEVISKTLYQSLATHVLTETQPEKQVYEITHRHEIGYGEHFIMNNGFKSFQSISKGQLLALSNHQPLVAPEKGKIFMPLYQPQGNDGYFIIKHIPYFYLKASALVRKIRLDALLALLPGFSWHDDKKKTLWVNKRIARFMAKDFLHLMGYRVKQRDAIHLAATKREDNQANKRYQYERWLKS